MNTFNYENQQLLFTKKMATIRIHSLWIALHSFMRERETDTHTHTHTHTHTEFIHFKVFFHTIVIAGKSENFRAVHKTINSSGLDVAGLNVKTILKAKFLLKETSVFSLKAFN
jgi:hypothetical protein